MRAVKRVVAVLAVLIVTLLVLAFVLENQQDVSLSLLGLETGHMAVSLFVVVALIVGLLIGPLLGVVVSRHRKSIKK